MVMTTWQNYEGKHGVDSCKVDSVRENTTNIFNIKTMEWDKGAAVPLYKEWKDDELYQIKYLIGLGGYKLPSSDPKLKLYGVTHHDYRIEIHIQIPAPIITGEQLAELQKNVFFVNHVSKSIVKGMDGIIEIPNCYS